MANIAVPEGTEPGLTVTSSRSDDCAVVELAGELDLATAGLVRDELDAIHAEAPRRIVISLKGLSFIDSTGLALIVSEVGRCKKQGAPDLELWAGPPSVQRLFEIAGVRDRLPFTAPSVASG